jgi:SpoIIAA-like
VPLTYRIDVARRLVVSLATGRLTDADLQQHQQQLQQDPAFAPSLCQLVDWTGVTDLAVTTEGLRQRVRQSIFHPGAPRAMVVSSPVQYGMARMIQTLQEFQGGTIRVFRDRAAAQAWLDEACGVPSPPIDETRGIP